MKFSDWLRKRIDENKKSKPVQMPKQETNKIKIKDSKNRLPSGRKETSFDSRPKRLRTRSAQNRSAIEE